ncbi:MAG TPA: radical SAM protein [Bacteroidales bacterium]|nr:radical SAM protein [Bacteroidales bacterium]
MSVLSNFIKVDRKCRRKFLINMGWKGFLGIRKFRKRSRSGGHFPAFQFISITNDCNLRCQGCWVSSNGKKEYMSLEKINNIIEAGKKQGSYFFGILGGEPLMHKDLIKIFKNHSDCYFQLFTNGILFNKSIASQLREAGNVTPLISLEGDETIADIRRGGSNVYLRTLNAISTATSEGLITGVAISVCKSNIEMALSEEFIRMLHSMGVLYVWYYIYRPAGNNPNYELALDSDDILRLRKFLVEGRTKLPVVLIDSYWDAMGEPFCPAAEGLSHHINSAGYIEPCPVVQFACENISDGRLENIYENSEFLKGFKNEIQHKTNGCIFMEDPRWLKELASKYYALNTSNRAGYITDLEHAPEVTSHGSCPVIPEKNLIYRLAKKTAFFGMGAYG